MARDITLKQQRFAAEYLKTGNGTEAARVVYGNRSYNTLSVIASQNLRNPRVREQVRKLREEIAHRAADVVMWLAEHAESEYVRFKSCQDILDRAGIKAPKVQQNTEVIVHLSSVLAKKHGITTQEDVGLAAPNSRSDF